MKSFPVGELKTNFSEIIDQVRSGEEIIITYGKKKENVAVIIPYENYKSKKIRLGLLAGMPYEIKDDFEMTEEELLGL